MAKMPKYAKIQNLLGRRKPRRSAVAFVNSPFGLWLLSAIFVSVGGAVISNRQECVASARSDIDAYNRLSYELWGRRARVMFAIRDSSTSIDLIKALQSNAYSDFKEFDGQSLKALVDQQRRIASHIQFSKQTSDEINSWRFKTGPRSWISF